MVFDVIVNIIAVIVAAVVAMVLAFIWYSPSVFGNKWLKLSGIDKKKAAAMKKKGMGKTMLVGFIASLVMAYVLAVFIKATGVATMTAALALGFWAWLGFIATVIIGGVLWKGEPVELYALNAAYWLVAMLAQSAILFSWI